jgi:hypothetical protein
VTYAQRGEQVLKKVGIDCVIRRTPGELSNRGCGYCLYLRGQDALAAAELLRDQRVPFVKIYTRRTDGKMEEREL